MLLIPAIDLKEGKCVRLRQGRMDDETVFSDDPIAMAARWVSEGTRRLHLVDLDGAFAGKPKNSAIIKEIAQNHPNLPIQIGGGIRDMATVSRYLEAGIRYTIIGTKAVEDPHFISECCHEFPDHIIVGLDAKGEKVAVDGWAEVSNFTTIDLAKQFENVGVSAIVYTDISRDGMMSGVNIKATQTLAESISIPVIASGGVSNMDDLKALSEIENSGIIGAITGRAIYEGSIDLKKAQTWLDQR